MKLYCLTCDEYRRSQIMEPQLDRLCTINKNLNPLFIKGYTPADLVNTIDAIYTYNPISLHFSPKDFKNNTILAGDSNVRQLRPSEIAISLSFYKMTQMFYESQETSCIFCEDDITFLTSDIVSDIKKYLQNTGFDVKMGIPQINKKPYIFYGCYIERLNLQAITKLSTEHIFKRSQPSYGNPLYIINRKFAQLILRNFFPIRYAYDDFLRDIITRYKVRCFKASPMLAYELSSDYYKAFYKAEDIIHKKNLERRSKQIDLMPKTISIAKGLCSTLSRYLLKHCKLRLVHSSTLKSRKEVMEECQIGSSKEATPALLADWRRRPSSDKIDLCAQEQQNFLIAEAQGLYILLIEALEKGISDKAIICGSGIHEPEIFQKLNKEQCDPFLILSVRGPLTRDLLLTKNIFCPYRFGDPLLIISNIIIKNDYQAKLLLAKDDKVARKYESKHDKDDNHDKQFKIGIICREKELKETTKLLRDKILEKNIIFVFIDVNYYNLEQVIERICQCDYLFSNLLLGIILGHSYNKKTVWMTLDSMKYEQKFRFIDYYEGIKTILGYSKNVKTIPKNYETPLNLRKDLACQKLESIILKSFNPTLPELDRLKNKVLKNNPILQHVF